MAYANPPAASTMGLTGLINRVSVVPAAGYTGADVKAQATNDLYAWASLEAAADGRWRALLAMLAVTAVQGAAATTDAVDQTMLQFTEVLVITLAIAMSVALLIAYNAAAINAEERTRETATMFAYGIGVAG